jgi:hypothetical protein
VYVGVGRGVFAGVTYRPKALIDLSPTVPFPIEETWSIQLMNYIFGSDHEDYILALLGPSMLLNHHVQNVNSKYVWMKDPSTSIPLASVRDYSPQSRYTPIAFRAKKTIFAGDEVFTSYGEDDWFKTRDISYKTAADDGSMELSRPLAELERTGHCLSDVSVRDSGIPGAGQGLFAERAFRQGDVVSISPVLVMPKHILDEIDTHSVLINYVMSLPGSDVTLFPLGRAGVANNGGKDNSSLSVHWYDWDDRRIIPHGELPGAVRYKHIEEIESAPFASLDISYVATRDIQAGEELTIFYGEQWESTWKVYNEMLEKYEKSQTTGGRVRRPIFLEPVGLNSAMFPAAWMVPCIGISCDEYSAEEEEEEVDIKVVAKEKGFGSASNILNAHKTTVTWAKSGSSAKETPKVVEGGSAAGVGSEL